MVDTLQESESKLIFYRTGDTTHKIVEIRNPGSRYERVSLFEIDKIKGKPYYLRLTAYTTVTADMIRKLDPEYIKNNMNCLKNYVLTSDSVAEMSISLSNLVDTGASLEAVPTLTITDLIAEIEEVDVAEDGISETDEESKGTGILASSGGFNQAAGEAVSDSYSMQKSTFGASNTTPTDKKENSQSDVKPVSEQPDIEEEKVDTNANDEDEYATPDEDEKTPEADQEIPVKEANSTEDVKSNEESAQPEPEEEVKELTPDEQFAKELAECLESERPTIQKAYDGIKKLTALAESTDWEKSEEKDGVTCSTMDADGGLKSVKSQGVMKYTPEQVIEYLGREDAPKQYDEMYDGHGTLQELSLGTKFAYTTQKGQWPVQGRDFCRLAITRQYPDGTVIMSNFSHEHPDYPPNKKFTRGEIIIGGWILKPDPSNPKHTLAVSVNQVDPKGSIPKSLVNKAIKKRGFVVQKVSEAMNKHF